MGYVYILSNQSYLSYVVKIGKTKNTPIIRAKQIYSGATGVPEHFNVVYVCQVPDCNVAEKEIHKTLRSYRKNHKREFFNIPVEIAKDALILVCERLFGRSAIKVIIDEKDDVVSKKESSFSESYEIEHSGKIFSIPIHALSESPIGTSVLNDSQKIRVSVINKVFQEVCLMSFNEMVESFSRNHNPENEIKIWEYMVKAYIEVTSNDLVSYEFKVEAYLLLLHRSFAYKSKVLKERKRNVIDDRTAKRILDAYKLKPKPLSVRVIKT